MSKHAIPLTYLSQEELIESGALDFPLAIKAAADSLVAYKRGDILFPEKIVQIFDEETQNRINCLPATLVPEKICGMKWVSVFPRNPALFGVQNLSAFILLSEIEKGFPLAAMDGTLCSNMRVAAMGALAARHCAREDAETIGFVGAGEQAKMHLPAMCSVRPGLRVCKVAAGSTADEEAFIACLQPLLPQITFVPCATNLEAAVRDTDILVTATSAHAPLVKADWIGDGVFYSHIGGWEDEFAVVRKADKIICDDWETVKHRDQTVSLCYHEKVISDADIYGNIADIVDNTLPGRENNKEFIYFNAVGLSYVDVAIAYAMYTKAVKAGFGKQLFMQERMIFDHDLTGKLSL